MDYVVKDGEVVIIDEFTGRMMTGRRYSDGLHQALEAKEAVKIENENQTGELLKLFKGDTFFPKINSSDWEETHQGRRFIATKTTQGLKQEKDSKIYFQRFIYTRISKKENA